MNIKNIFKFTISPILREPSQDAIYQRFAVAMEAPSFVFEIPINLSNSENIKLQHKLGKAEIKLAIIEALLNGEWHQQEF